MYLSRVWWVADIEELLHPAWGLGDWAAVGEVLEGGLSAVSTLSGVTDTTEWHGWHGGVEEGVVDGGAAGSDAEEDLVDFGLVAEGVETEWSLVNGVGDSDGLIEVLDWEDWHQWAERLVLDERVVLGVDNDDSWLNVLLRCVGLTADDNAALCGVEHLLDAIEVILRDNAGKVLRVLGSLWVELLHGDLHLLNELVQDILIDHSVVLRYADLAGVEEFTPEKTAGSKTDVSVASDNGWVTTTKLKADWSKSLSSLLGDNGSDLRVSSVEDLIPLLVQESSGLLNGTLNNLVCIVVQILVHNLLQDSSGVWRDLRWLHNTSASSGNSTNEWSQSKLNWEVPAPDNQNSSQWLLADNWAHELVGEAHIWCLLIGSPLLKVLGDEDDIILAPLDLGDLGLEGGLVQVALAGLEESWGVVAQSPVELAELLDAVGEWAGLLGEVGSLGGIDNALDVLDWSRNERWDGRHRLSHDG